jgi:hypothetical protein
MLTETDDIPSHFVKTQRLETLIFFVAVFHLAGPKLVRQNYQNDRPLVTGNLSQVKASLGTRPLCQYSRSGSSGNNEPFGVSFHTLGWENFPFRFVVRFPACKEDSDD